VAEFKDPECLSRALISLVGDSPHWESLVDCIETRGFDNPDWAAVGQHRDGRIKDWRRLIRGERDENGKVRGHSRHIPEGNGAALATIVILALCGAAAGRFDAVADHMRAALDCWIGRHEFSPAPEADWISQFIAAWRKVEGNGDVYAQHFARTYLSPRYVGVSDQAAF
jgi:hypothetical protein